MKLEENLHTFILNELKSMGVRVPKSKKRITLCKKNQSGCYETNPDQIFGVSLASQEWITVDCHGTPVPRFLAMVTENLLQHKECEGLFRKTGSVIRQRELRKFIENGGNFDNTAPHDVTALLKQWFRELPESVIPRSLHDIFLNCYQVEENRTAACLLACLLLPPEHLYTLQHTMNFLSNIAKNSSQNKMNALNLALIIAPNLLPASKQSSEKTRTIVDFQTGLICLLIENEDKVGHLPSDIAEKLGSFGLDYTSSEDGLDKSDDLDGPTKPKKKRRSGTVQELVSGIRKFVSHKRTPLQPLPVTSNVCSPMRPKEQDEHNSPTCRSASKRKVDCTVYTEEKKTCHEMTPSCKFYNIPETKEILKLTPILPSAMISLSDVDCDSPSELKYKPSPVVKTYRKSLRIVKSKYRQRDTSLLLKDRANLYIKNNGRKNIITTVAEIHKSDTPKRKKGYSPNTMHLTKQVEMLSILSPSQEKLLSGNENAGQQKENKVNNENLTGNETGARGLDASESSSTSMFTQSESFQRCTKINISEERQKSENFKKDTFGRGKREEQTNSSLNAKNGGSVRKVGSTRTGKGNSKGNIQKHVSSCSVTRKGNSTKRKSERHSSHLLKENKGSSTIKANSKTKLEKKVSAKNYKESVRTNAEREMKLRKKTSSTSLKEKGNVSKPELQKKLSSCSSEDQKPTATNPEQNNFKRNVKSSLRRGRPNTIKTGLPPSTFIKHCSDSAISTAVKINLPNNDNPETSLKRITRSKSALSEVFQDESVISNEMLFPKLNELKRKTSIASNSEESLLYSDILSPKLGQVKSKTTIASSGSLIRSNISNNGTSEMPLTGNKISVCSTPLEGSCLRKPLFIDHDSTNNSPLHPQKELNHITEYKYASSKVVSQIENTPTDARSSISHSFLVADNISLPDVSLQEDDSKKKKYEKENTELGVKVENSNSNSGKDESLKAYRKDISSDLMVTPIESHSVTVNSEDLSKSHEDTQWTSALEYLSKHESEISDFTKRESIIKLRIRNAGMVKASVQRYNSIGGNGSFCTPEICKTHKSQSPATVNVPSVFTRNNVGMGMQYGKTSSKSKTSTNSRLTDPVSKSETCNNTNSEFKVPTPLRKTRKIQSHIKETIC